MKHDVVHLNNYGIWQVISQDASYHFMWYCENQPYNPWEQGSWGLHGAHLGRQDPGGPHVGPMILAIWDALMLFKPRNVSIIPYNIFQSATEPFMLIINATVYLLH